MTINHGLFIRNVGSLGTNPLEARLALAGLLAENSPGVPRQGLLWQTADPVVTGNSDMSYNVLPCVPAINRAVNEGVYVMAFTGTTNIATTAAPASGSRYDLIYVKQDDVDKGDADNSPVLGVIQGAASSTPSVPTSSLPAGAMVLGQALVTVGATSTNGSGVTITQQWVHTVARGASIPVRTQAERDAITAGSGTTVRRLDLGGTVETLSNGIWSMGMEHAEFYGSQTVLPSQVWGPGILPADTSRSVNGGFATMPSSDVVQVSKAGVYAISFMCTFPSAVGTTYLAIRTPDGTTETYATVNAVAGAGGASVDLPNLQLSANQQFSVKVFQSSGGNQTWTCRIRITRLR